MKVDVFPPYAEPCRCRTARELPEEGRAGSSYQSATIGTRR